MRQLDDNASNFHDSLTWLVSRTMMRCKKVTLLGVMPMSRALYSDLDTRHKAHIETHKDTWR